MGYSKISNEDLDTISSIKESLMSHFLKYLLFGIILFFLFACFAPEEEKTEVLKVPEKITMLFVSQPSCPSCDKLEETMQLEKPHKLISNYFYFKKIYLGEQLPDGLMQPNGTPTVYFLGADDEVLVEPLIGEKTEAGLMEFLEDALLEFKIAYKVDLVKERETNNANKI
ncbi:MAG: Unknown protein [uncultured Sulfurovum sp.]|uniref:Thioredoxin-like fold domain-containing protein n=1 Tax=uncultured Sulfurovum sp. TaxID=269237 RepID=A0A6S6U2R5_9BACT|nr:MAG: Unknown protein [uncultured Sulfurovum sp.]